MSTIRLRAPVLLRNGVCILRSGPYSTHPGQTGAMIIRRALAVLVAAAVAVALLGFVWPAWFRAAHATGSVAFPRTAEPGYGLFRMGADGSDVRRIAVPLEGKMGFPRYSPDGTRLAFVGEVDGVEDLFVAEANGATPRAIAPT